MAASKNSTKPKKNAASAAALADPEEWAQVLTTLADLAGGGARRTARPAAARKSGDDGKATVKPLAPRVTLWRAYRAPLAPLHWMLEAETAGLLAWVSRPAAHGQVRALILTVAVLAAGCIAAHRAWWQKHPAGGKGRPKRTRAADGTKNPPWALSRSYLLTGWLTGSAWTAVASAHPVGPKGLMQFTLLIGGLLLAAPHMHYRRYRPVPFTPAAVAELPSAEGEDERLAKLRAYFNRKTGPLKDAHLHGFEEVPDGFTLQLKLADESEGTREAVVGAKAGIAKLYDVPGDQVTVEQAKKRSEGRAKLTILTTENALERVEVWDGQSTYNPRTGLFDLGMFLDSQTTHWLLHRPNSGSFGGVIAGMIGAGKTGTTHVMACEAGQAKLCAVCGAAGSCGQCQTERICALWMGDPQMQGFSVWRGHADLCGWGPEGCVQLLQWGHAVMRRRAAWLGNLRWQDHLGRENKGKGWFDPAVGLPVIYIVIDEWPLIAANPDLARIAVPLAAQIGKEGRKAGVSMVFMTQIPDLTELGERAVREMLKAANVVSHRTDGLSKFMLGIEGNPQELPAGVHGLGFVNNVDARPAATFRTKHIREFLQPWETGVDVREIAGRIAADRMIYDPTVIETIGPLGYSGQGHVLDGSGCDFGDGEELPPGMDGLLGIPRPGAQGMPAAPAPQAIPAAPVPLLGGPASLDALSRVARSLDARGAGGAELYDVMTDTGLSALDAQRAAAVLVSQGQVTQNEAGRLVPARQQ